MKWKIWAALVAVWVVWGSTYLAIRFAVETMPPFLMAGVRFLISGAMLYIWRRAAGDDQPRRIEWRSAAMVGLLLLVGGNGSVVWSEQRVVSGIAALLVSVSPLWMVLIDLFRPANSSKVNRKPTWQAIVGVLVGLAGIVILVGPRELASGNAQLDTLGVLGLMFASLFWAMGSLYGRDAKLPDSPLLATGMEMLAGGAGLVLLGTLTGEWARLDIASISARSLWGLLYLILCGSLVGFAAYTWLLRVAPTPLVATYAYVNPLIAILVGSLLASEPLNARIFLAALVIVASVALINAGRSAPRRQPQRAEVASGMPSAGDD